MLFWELVLVATLVLAALAGARMCLPLLQLLRRAYQRLQGRVAPFPNPGNRNVTHRLIFRHMSAEERDGFLSAWQSVSRRFETDPQIAITYADLLISGLVQRAGDPDCGHRIAPVGLLQGELRDKYMAAHEIAFHETHTPASVEEFKRAMTLYEILFRRLVGESRRPASRCGSCDSGA